jgi:hypothetical protein
LKGSGVQLRVVSLNDFFRDLITPGDTEERFLFANPVGLKAEGLPGFGSIPRHLPGLFVNLGPFF